MGDAKEKRSMKKRVMALTSLAVLLAVLAACGGYAPASEPAGRRC